MDNFDKLLQTIFAIHYLIIRQKGQSEILLF